MSNFDCSKNRLTKIDISNTTKITNFNCSGNNLTSVDVTKNKALQYLYVASNPRLKKITIGTNSNLQSFFCYDNALSSIDVTGCPNLDTLSCSSNSINSLNLNNNTKLTSLACEYNKLKILDLTKNINLTELTCYNNWIAALNLSNNKKLTKISATQYIPARNFSGVIQGKFDMSNYSDFSTKKVTNINSATLSGKVFTLTSEIEYTNSLSYVYDCGNNKKINIYINHIDEAVSSYDTPTVSSITNTTNGVKLTLERITGVYYYRVFRKTAGGSWNKLADTTSLSYVDKTAVKDRKYTYTVRCVSADGKKSTSAYNTNGKTITRK